MLNANRHEYVTVFRGNVINIFEYVFECICLLLKLFFTETLIAEIFVEKIDIINKINYRTIGLISRVLLSNL